MTAFLRRLAPIRWLGLDRPPDAALTPAQVEANIRHLVWDITWFGVAWGSVVSYLQVYVVRLDASSLLVGAITYGPALIAIAWQLPAARLITRAGRRLRWVVGGGLIYRLMFLAVALVPFVAPDGAAAVTAAVWVLAAFPQTVSNTAFLSMLADAVPPDRLTQVVGWRMAGFGLANTLTMLAAGVLLPRLPLPLNYQLLFLIGFAGSMIGWWHVRQLRVPDREPDRAVHPAIWLDVGRMLRHPGFAGLLAGVAALQLAIGMTAPLLPLYWVRRLGAGDAQISMIMTLASAMMVVGSLFMRRAVARIGRERALAAGALGYALYPMLTSLTPSVWLLVPWAVLSGLFSAAINVNLFDNLVSVTPAEDRTSYIAVHNVVVSAALFAGPLLSTAVASGEESIAWALRIAALVGLLSGALLAARRSARLPR